MKIARIELPSGDVTLAALQDNGCFFRLEGDLFGELADTGEVIEGKQLAPLVPCDIYCIGLNYAKHAAEGGKPVPDNPVVFMKSTAAVQNPGDPIVLPRRLHSGKVDYECELVVVIGKRCKNVAAANALDYVLGYTVGNDVSARDWQRNGGGGQWIRGKSFDTFAPLGPVLVTTDELTNPQNLALKTTIGERVLQDWTTSDMIFSVAQLIEFVSGSTTLLPGTAIFTGTPHGVGFAQDPPVYLQPGDVVTTEIERIGALKNPVIEETDVEPLPGLNASEGKFRF